MPAPWVRSAFALAVVCCAAQAQAANWAGWYGGVHGDFGWNRAEVDLDHSDLTPPTANFNLATVSPEITFNWKGWMGGAQLGRNWRVGTAGVLGFETGLSAGKVDGSKTVVANVPGYATFSNTVVSKTDALATLRMRAGLLPISNVLVYVTSGGAAGNVRHSRDTLFSMFQGPTGSASERKFGWAIGGGAELEIASGVSMRAEYLFIDLGDSKFTTIYPSTGARIAGTAMNNINLVTGGLDFSF